MFKRTFMHHGCKHTGLLILRVVVGIIFLHHGIGKFSNIDGTIQFFGSLGLAPLFAYLVAFVETAGGVALITGAFARYAGYALAITMLVAIFVTGSSEGIWKHELEATLLVASLAIAFIGPGKYSIKHGCGCHMGCACGCGCKKCMANNCSCTKTCACGAGCSCGCSECKVSPVVEKSS
jgi:putative oxidoreductase